MECELRRGESRVNGRYPDFWYGAVIQSGLINEVLGPGSDEITLSAF